MKNNSRGSLVLLACVLGMSAASAAASKPQTDSLGRVVRDASGQRWNFRQEARQAGPVLPHTSAHSTAPAKTSAQAAQRKAAPGGSVRFNAEGAWAAYRENWRFDPWGWGIGAQGFFPVDVDSDGDQELVYGLAGQNWAIADYFPSAQEHRVIWKSPAMAISHMRVVQSGNTRTVWIAGNADGIRVYDALTRTLLDTLPLPVGVSVFDMAVGDGNNDGSLDVMLLADDRILFFDAVTLEARPSAFFTQPGPSEFEVGNVDDDAETEIVFRDGRVLRVNGSNVSVEWNRGEAFGYRMLLADIDGDQRDELVATPTGWNKLEAWNLEARTLKWERTTALDIAAVRAFDVNADGVKDVVYADAQWGSIHAVNGETNSVIWSIGNPEHGVTDVVVLDADNDGALEVLWGAGYSHSGPDILYRASIAGQNIEWQSFDVSNSFYAVDVGDVDLDGRLELVFSSVSSQSGYQGGGLMIHDAITHEPEYRDIPEWLSSSEEVFTLRIANVDADPQPEIIMGANGGRLIVVDGLTHVRQGDWPVENFSAVTRIDIADVDNDGANDVVVGTSFHMYAINPRTGAELWKSPALPTYQQSVKAADVGDPGLDLIVVSNNVHRFRWSDKQQTSSVGANYASVLPLDVTGSAALEILAQRYDGPVDVLDGETLQVLSTLPVTCGSLTNSTLVAVEGPVIAYVCNDDIYLYDVQLQSVMSHVDTGMAWTAAYGSLVPFVLQGKPAFFAGGDLPHVFIDLITNEAPAVSPRNVSMHWRSESTDITLSGTDANSNALTWQVVSLPAFGDVRMLDKAGGTVRYSPRVATKGTDSFLVRASDGFELSASTPVNLTLTNTAPVASTSMLSFHWRGAQTAKFAGTDADGDPVTVALGSAPVRGTLTLLDATTGDVRFEPSGAFVGTDAATYAVSDGVDTSATGNVQITLTNTVPTAGALAFDVTLGTTTLGQVAGVDANGDPLTYAIGTAPSRGTLTVDVNGALSYVPAAGTGDVTATVVVSDGVSSSSPVTLTFHYAAAGGGGGGGSSGGVSGKGGGGALDLLVLAALLTGMSRRALRKAHRVA